MKRMMMTLAIAAMAAFAVFAVEDTVTVKASVEAAAANSRAKNECATKAKKLAVEKYLGRIDSGMPETLVKKAVQDYKKYVDEIESDEGDFEDGEFSCEYKITIKREALMQFLSSEGWNMSAGAKDTSGNPIEIELVIAEDPPDVGAMKVADAFGTGLDGKNFFFTRYTEFQKTIRDALVDQLNKIGIQAPLLEDNPAYADLKAQDPCCLGVYFDPGVGDKGDFKITPNYIQLIQSNNPDTMVLYYRVGSLVFEAEQRKAFVNVSIAIKNLTNNKTIQIGRADHESPTITSKQQDRIMMEMATAVCRATNKILSGEDAGGKIMNAIKTLKAEAAKPAGPMTIVVNMSKVDKKIVDEVMIEFEDKVVEKGLCKSNAFKTTGSSMIFTLKDGAVKNNDPKRAFVAVKKVLIDAGLPEEWVQGDCKTVNGNRMTIVPGKETSGD